MHRPGHGMARVALNRASQIPETRMAKINLGESALANLRDRARWKPNLPVGLSGQRWVVLFFYPKDGTPVCTKEACAFRDSYEKFAAAGAVVVGVSSDTAERHREFARQNSLSFPLLSDTDGSVRAVRRAKNLGSFPGTRDLRRRQSRDHPPDLFRTVRFRRACPPGSDRRRRRKMTICQNTRLPVTMRPSSMATRRQANAERHRFTQIVSGMQTNG